MSTSASVVVTTVTPVTLPVPKTNWLKRVGHFLGNILKFIVNEEPKIAAMVVPTLEAAFPQFAPLIAGGDALATKIIKQIFITETAAVAVGKAVTSADKVNAALAGVGHEIDAWVAAAFPGSKTLSDPGKKNLIGAFVAAANELTADILPVNVPSAPVTK